MADPTRGGGGWRQRLIELVEKIVEPGGAEERARECVTVLEHCYALTSG